MADTKGSPSGVTSEGHDDASRENHRPDNKSESGGSRGGARQGAGGGASSDAKSGSGIQGGSGEAHDEAVRLTREQDQD